MSRMSSFLTCLVPWCSVTFFSSYIISYPPGSWLVVGTAEWIQGRHTSCMMTKFQDSKNKMLPGRLGLHMIQHHFHDILIVKAVTGSVRSKEVEKYTLPLDRKTSRSHCRKSYGMRDTGVAILEWAYFACGEYVYHYRPEGKLWHLVYKDALPQSIMPYGIHVLCNP